jgi:hypothetical protein
VLGPVRDETSVGKGSFLQVVAERDAALRGARGGVYAAEMDARRARCVVSISRFINITLHQYHLASISRFMNITLYKYHANVALGHNCALRRVCI